MVSWLDTVAGRFVRRMHTNVSQRLNHRTNQKTNSSWRTVRHYDVVNSTDTIINVGNVPTKILKIRTMANNTYTRVLVHLRRTSQGAYQLAKFSECILDLLGIAGDGLVKCHLENNQLHLQRPDENDENATFPGTTTKPSVIRIMHPPFCPVQHLDEEGSVALPEEIKTRGVDVGVAILLESSDKRLLLTRRAAHMRTFPGVWVPPGGHVEDEESLEDAVLRELEEETGLVVTAAERQSSHILGLWESVFPPLLSLGHPKRHHVVVYIHMILERSSEELQNQFKLCPEEVDAAVWLSVDLVKLAAWKRGQFIEQEQELGLSKPSYDEEIQITLVTLNGEHAAGTIEASVLRESDKTSDLNYERISTGSRFALSLWLEQQSKESNLPKSSQKELYKNFMRQSVTKGDGTSTSLRLKPKI